MLEPDINDYWGSSFSTYGFRVLVHDPYDFPDANSQTSFIQARDEALISVIPDHTYSTSQVMGQNIEIRGCYDANEIPMLIMSQYSFINCRSECWHRMFLDACHCVPVHFIQNSTTKICQLEQYECFSSFIGEERKNNFKF